MLAALFDGVFAFWFVIIIIIAAIRFVVWIIQLSESETNNQARPKHDGRSDPAGQRSSPDTSDGKSKPTSAKSSPEPDERWPGSLDAVDTGSILAEPVTDKAITRLQFDVARVEDPQQRMFPALSGNPYLFERTDSEGQGRSSRVADLLVELSHSSHSGSVKRRSPCLRPLSKMLRYHRMAIEYETEGSFSRSNYLFAETQRLASRLSSGHKCWAETVAQSGCETSEIEAKDVHESVIKELLIDTHVGFANAYDRRDVKKRHQFHADLCGGYLTEDVLSPTEIDEIQTMLRLQETADLSWAEEQCCVAEEPDRLIDQITLMCRMLIDQGEWGMPSRTLTSLAKHFPDNERLRLGALDLVTKSLEASLASRPAEARELVQQLLEIPRTTQETCTRILGVISLSRYEPKPYSFLRRIAELKNRADLISMLMEAQPELYACYHAYAQLKVETANALLEESLCSSALVEVERALACRPGWRKAESLRDRSEEQLGELQEQSKMVHRFVSSSALSEWGKARSREAIQGEVSRQRFLDSSECVELSQAALVAQHHWIWQAAGLSRSDWNEAEADVLCQLVQDVRATSSREDRLERWCEAIDSESAHERFREIDEERVADLFADPLQASSADDVREGEPPQVAPRLTIPAKIGRHEQDLVSIPFRDWLLSTKDIAAKASLAAAVLALLGAVYLTRSFNIRQAAFEDLQKAVAGHHEAAAEKAIARFTSVSLPWKDDRIKEIDRLKRDMPSWSDTLKRNIAVAKLAEAVSSGQDNKGVMDVAAEFFRYREGLEQDPRRESVQAHYDKALATWFTQNWQRESDWKKEVERYRQLVDAGS